MTDGKKAGWMDGWMQYMGWWEGTHYNLKETGTRNYLRETPQLFSRIPYVLIKTA